MSKPVYDLYGRPVMAPQATPTLTDDDLAALIVGHEVLAGQAMVAATLTDDADARTGLLAAAERHLVAMARWGASDGG